MFPTFHRAMKACQAKIFLIPCCIIFIHSMYQFLRIKPSCCGHRRSAAATWIGYESWKAAWQDWPQGFRRSGSGLSYLIWFATWYFSVQFLWGVFFFRMWSFVLFTVFWMSCCNVNSPALCKLSSDHEPCHCKRLDSCDTKCFLFLVFWDWHAYNWLQGAWIFFS